MATQDAHEVEGQDADQLVDELIAPLYETRFLQTDARGQITGWNAQAEELFGWPRQEVLGSAFVDTMIPPESRDAYRAGFESFLATGDEPILGRVRLRHRDGRVMPVALAIVPIPLTLGYHFNRLLQALREPLASRGDIERLEQAHEDVVGSIRESLRLGLMGHELGSDFWRRNSIAFPDGVPLPPDAAEKESGTFEEPRAGQLGGALAIYRLLGDAEEPTADEEPIAVAPSTEVAQAPAPDAPDDEREELRARVQELEGELAAAREALERAQAELAETNTELDQARRRAAEADAAVEEAEARAREARDELARARSQTPIPPSGEQPEEPVARRASQSGLVVPAVAPERIRAALDQDSFAVYWQPTQAIESGEMDHIELLLRLEDESGRLTLPEVFLDAARAADLMIEVDHWVLRRAVRLMSERADLRVAFNLSAESVADPDTALVFEQELSALPVDPSGLIVDVSERHAVNQMEAVNRLQKRIRALGVRFALDDFGSTFGSFRCLKHMRLDYLKLDGELIDSIMESRTDQLVVKALVDVARGLGIETIAEFVSDEETLEHVRGLGVSYAQGYAIGRPKPVSELPAPGHPS